MADKEPVAERPGAAEEEEDASAVAAAAGEEEDTGAQVAPIVRLEEVAVTTGEEDEDVLLDMKAKLYRFDKDGNQWKERGTGTVKLLKHKETGKVRLVMRQAKTLKICANHLVASSTKMQEHAGSDKSCVWHAADFADGELKEEMFAIRFGSVENCKKFKDLVEEIAESLTKSEGKENEDSSSTAGLLEKLSVSENKSERFCRRNHGRVGPSNDALHRPLPSSAFSSPYLLRTASPAAHRASLPRRCEPTTTPSLRRRPERHRQSHGRTSTASRTKSTLATKSVLYKIKSVAKKSIINEITTIPQSMDAQILKFPNSEKSKIRKPQIIHGRRRIQLTRVPSQLPKLARRGTLPSRAGGRGDNGRRRSEPLAEDPAAALTSSGRGKTLPAPGGGERAPNLDPAAESSPARAATPPAPAGRMPLGHTANSRDSSGGRGKESTRARLGPLQLRRRRGAGGRGGGALRRRCGPASARTGPSSSSSASPQDPPSRGPSLAPRHGGAAMPLGSARRQVDGLPRRRAGDRPRIEGVGQRRMVWGQRMRTLASPAEWTRSAGDGT